MPRRSVETKRRQHGGQLTVVQENWGSSWVLRKLLNKRSVYGVRIKLFPKEFPKMSLLVRTPFLSQTRDWVIAGESVSDGFMNIFSLAKALLPKERKQKLYLSIK